MATQPDQLPEATRLAIANAHIGFLWEHLVRAVDRLYGEQVARGMFPSDQAAQMAASDRENYQRTLGQIAQQVQEQLAQQPANDEKPAPTSKDKS